MSDPEPLQSKIPRRSLLADQTADYLRERIRAGEWQRTLPSESSLCRELQVSRVTLRRALEQLVRDELIVLGGRGTHHRINAKAIRPATPIPQGKVIRVLAPFSFWKMGAVSHAILDGLSKKISASGLRVEFESRSRLFEGNQTKGLERLLDLPDTVGWVLFFSTKGMQQWFKDGGHPCVVAGRLYDDLEMSCVYPDSVAVARHAAGLLFSRGHRQIAHLIARTTSLSDRLAATAFEEEARKLGATVQGIEYAGDPSSVSRAMNFVFAARPRPTACYITCPEDAVCALCHTLHAGISVPEGLEFLVGFDDPILDYTVPSLAHYKFDGIGMGRKIGTLILDQLGKSRPKSTQSAMMAEFSPGGSLRIPNPK